MTKIPELLSAHLKLGRAQKLFIELNSSVRQFIERKPYQIERERDADTGDRILVYYSAEPIPLEWSLCIGEILYNLRSALDHAVWELTKHARIITLNKNVAFPILDHPNEFTSSTSVRGLKQATRDYIEAIQPYNAIPPYVEYLEILSVLNNIDKHRALHLCCFTAYGVQMIHLVKNLRINPRPRLEDGAKLAWWSPADKNSEMKMYADIAIEIAFDESSLDRFVTPEPISYLLECIMVRVYNVLNELKASVS